MVFIFIFATGGLLTWALLKPWIERYMEVSTQSIPCSSQAQEQKQSCSIGVACIDRLWILLVEVAANGVIYFFIGCSGTPIIHAC